MYWFLMEAIPAINSQHSQEYGGAYIISYINFAQQDGAELIARHYLEQEGWQPLHVEEVRWIGRDDVINDPEKLQYFSEAEQDGASFIYHTWPPGAEDIETSEDYLI